MQIETSNATLRVVDETEAAKAIGMSVQFLQKDRITKRRFRFYRIGKAVRYNLDTLREDLENLQEGGQSLRRSRRGVTA